MALTPLLHPYRLDVVSVTTTTVVVVEVGLGVTTTVTVTGGGVGSVVVGAAEFVDEMETAVVKVGVGDKAVAAQGVPTNMKSVVIIIQASRDCSDIIAIATLWTAARSSVVK